jgi:hypothetical protein
MYPVSVGFSINEINQYSKETTEKDFIRVLQSRLYFKDVYWMSTPIQSPRHFYGRQQLLADVASALTTSQSHVGLFGLRKMGKTSFLYRLLELLQKRSQCHVCYLDMQLIDAVNPTPEYFLWSLGSALLNSLGKQKIGNLDLLGRYKTFYSIKDKDAIPELFVSDLAQLLAATKKVFVVALDEIELMGPPNIIRGTKWGVDSFIKIWRILRGLDQQNPGRLSYFITGTNPRIVEISQIDGMDNPIYSYFRKEYLQPLQLKDSKELLVDIGTLIGMQWTDDALDLVHKRVGGHPLLLRAYGSVIHNAKLPRESQVNVVSADVIATAEDFILKVSPQLSQMLDVITDYYQDEALLLEILADGRIGEFRTYAATFPNEIAHLIGYGLIEYSGKFVEIAIEPLQTWLQRKRRATIEPGDWIEAKPDNIIGREIGGYVIDASIGHPGGFANVYKAKSINNSEYAAIKILRDGLLSNLQREVDVLSEFQHPGIVKLIGSGKTPEGIVYLIMEYLEGETLKAHCQRSLRLPADEIQKLTISLLYALAYLHPNIDKIEHLSSKKELSVQDFAELEKARHGRIHRDIKPENVILTTRGPVLIDFNISVAASGPIKTQSHTPGYLPPDMHPGQWTPDVDLYQLGLTIAQVATGIEYIFDTQDGISNIEDIREQLVIELPVRLSRVIGKLFAPNMEKRYTSAQEALRHLQ